jgi:Ohr subfamily peroxiredoxin
MTANELPSKTKDTLCIYYSRRFLPMFTMLAAVRSASFSSSSLWLYCFAAKPLSRSAEDFTKPRDGALNPIMKTLFTAEAISKGGRSGTIQTPDRLLNVTLGNPLEKGIEKRGPNPELLFAGAYSACYHGALSNAAKKLGTPVKDSTVRALVSLIEDDQGGYRLAVELHAQLPGIDRAQAQRIMDEAHKTCPYSRALRGDTSVKLVVD